MVQGMGPIPGAKNAMYTISATIAIHASFVGQKPYSQLDEQLAGVVVWFPTMHDPYTMRAP